MFKKFFKNKKIQEESNLNNVKDEKDLDIIEENISNIEDENIYDEIVEEDYKEVSKRESIISNIRFLRKKDIGTSDENELNDFEEELEKEEKKTLPSEKEEFKKKALLTTGIGTLSLVVLSILVVVLINISVDNPIKEQTYSKKPNNNVVQELPPTTNEKTETYRDNNYYKTISNLRYFKRNSNESIVEKNIQIEEEKKKKEEESKNQEPNQTTLDTNIPVVGDKENNNKNKSNTEEIKEPKSQKVKDMIEYTKELSIAALKTEACGIKNKFDFKNDKYELLQVALKDKYGKYYDDLTIYTLDEKYFKHLKNEKYNLKDFVVITYPTSLLGDILYIGNDGKGIKDSDSTIWFNENLYK